MKFEVIFRFSKPTGKFFHEILRTVHAKSHKEAIEEARIRCITPGMHYTVLSTKVIK